MMAWHPYFTRDQLRIKRVQFPVTHTLHSLQPSTPSYLPYCSFTRHSYPGRFAEFRVATIKYSGERTFFFFEYFYALFFLYIILNLSLHTIFNICVYISFSSYYAQLIVVLPPVRSVDNIFINHADRVLNFQ